MTFICAKKCYFKYSIGVKALKRQALEALNTWKLQPTRKPMLVDGARQTGKSYLLEKLFGQSFDSVIRLDFLENPSLSKLFEQSLNSHDIIEAIELTFNKIFDPETDLLIFDEIGECQAAVDSLKFFAEQQPTLFLVASGSNIGLLNSFPVGKVSFLSLHPMTFEEFLWASEEPATIKAYNNLNLSAAAHDKLFKHLLDYYFVGGMPEAVKTWHQSKQEQSTQTRIQAVTEVHKALLSGYELDFGKYSGKVSAKQISEVFNNIPSQLQSNQDGSVRRFQFKDVIPKKSRYNDLAGPIHWLEQCKLLSKCHPIDTQPQIPLKQLAKENLFKLFFFDIGLLVSALELSYKDIIDQQFNYKGFIAENFVQNELIAQGYSPTYSWSEARSEIEFIIRLSDGKLCPLEVKSGRRTRSKSLRVYRDKYQPELSFKLVGTMGNIEDISLKVLPIYFAGQLLSANFL